MVDTTKIADNYCIYWDSTSLMCTAPSYFSESDISCYVEKTHGCRLDGKCLDCSKYNVGGLQYTQKDVLGMYSSGFKLEWSDAVGRYLPVEVDGAPYYGNYTWQEPIHISVYNLRAQLKKCCYWAGSPLLFYITTGGVLYIAHFQDNGGSLSYIKYLDDDGVITDGAMNAISCTNEDASDWWYPNTSENKTNFGCNGCKPECPYYTGPTWTYCVDSKMSAGDAVSAAQILELRYYSRDWSSYNNPVSEWNKVFSSPSIVAWTGDYSEDDSGQKIPIVQRVYVESFDAVTPTLGFGPKVPLDTGVSVQDTSSSYYTHNYPSFIKELHDTISYLRILWPHNTSADKPFVFKFWDVDNAHIRIYFDAPFSSVVYAINVADYPQGDMSDSDFLQYMLLSEYENVVAVSTEGQSHLNYLDFPLTPGKSKINRIKLFMRDVSSTSETKYLTAECTVEARLYHAYAVQTKGINRKGNRTTSPIIERFDSIECEAMIHRLANYTEFYQVLLDSTVNGKRTVYPIEEVDTITVTGSDNIIPLSCGYFAIILDGAVFNSVYPWSVSGTSSNGTELGLSLYQYTIVASDEGVVTSLNNIVELEVVHKFNSGKYLPANVVIVKASSDSDPVIFDAVTDEVRVTYSYTEYKQAPVDNEDYSKLKYQGSAGAYTSLDMYKITTGGGEWFSVEGKCVRIVNKHDSSDVICITDWESVRNHIYSLLLLSETQAIQSFFAGGVFDQTIMTSQEIHEAAEKVFNDNYKDYVFADDNTPVTLFEVCERFSYLWAQDCDLHFTVVFADEDGVPIGTKRFYMLLQSAVVETRDVEIKYKWESKYTAWPIVDSLLLLAKYSEPTVSDIATEGIYSYEPKCGDHSEAYHVFHEFGDPGAMWYPYTACLSPTYHQDELTTAVKCKRSVEGFGSSYEGIRWDYWERMRSYDTLDTFVAGPIFLVGCFYREVSYSYQYFDPVFVGFTRIRSSHLEGPYCRDREAIRLSRHYRKREVGASVDFTAVSGDVIFDALVLGTPDWSVIDTPERGGLQTAVGAEYNTGIWTHINDGVSIVKLTSQETEHPFTHRILYKVGSYYAGESFSSERSSLTDIISYRDLTSSVQRKTDGSAVRVPVEAGVLWSFDEYDDIIPVFSDKTYVWGWLERQKDIERAALVADVDSEGNIVYYRSDRITGVHIDNPTYNVWTSDFQSAVQVSEGIHTVYYTPPVFTDDGSIKEYPSLRLDSGPPQYFTWPDGEPYFSDGSPYSFLAADTSFYFFGHGSNGEGFLMSGEGINRFVKKWSNGKVLYGKTTPGLSFYLVSDCSELPYEPGDRAKEIKTDGFLNVYSFMDSINLKLDKRLKTKRTFPLVGVFYVESVVLEWYIGVHIRYAPATTGYVETEAEYAVPPITIYTSDGTKTTEVYRKEALYFSDRYTYKWIDDKDYELTTGETDLGYISSIGGGYTIRQTIPVGKWVKTLTLDIGVASNHFAKIDDFRIMYRKPKALSEDIRAYQQKANVSKGNTGNIDYRSLLYYYTRDYMEHGHDLALKMFQIAGFAPDVSASAISTTKILTDTVKDVILEYDYNDASGLRFPYKSSTHPSSSPYSITDQFGRLAVGSSIEISTKGSTLLAEAHVDDSPQWVSHNMLLVPNSANIANNEYSGCASNAGNHILGEDVQECLYNHAKSLVYSDDSVDYDDRTETIYNWFWHPDERSFWENEIGVILTDPPPLKLYTAIPDLHDIFRYEFFGCTSYLSVPYFDGMTHYIPGWSALGHRLYTGNPLFNHTCFDVVIFKIEDHIGERTYGTSKYGGVLDEFSWSYDTYRDAFSYLDAGLVEKSGYFGGAIGGVGPAFWAAQVQLSYNLTPPQVDTEREIDERLISLREEAVRADG